MRKKFMIRPSCSLFDGRCPVPDRSSTSFPDPPPPVRVGRAVFPGSAAHVRRRRVPRPEGPRPKPASNGRAGYLPLVLFGQFRGKWTRRGRLDSVLALCEHGGVNVISSTTIKRYAALHADAAEELLRWNKAATPFGGTLMRFDCTFPMPTSTSRC